MQTIGNLELALGSLLVLVHGVISLWYRTGIAKPVIIAACRMLIQLGIMAYVLQFLFKSQSGFLTALAVLFMLVFAGFEILNRQKRKIKGVWGYGIGLSSLVCAASIVMGFALIFQLNADPWYNARYLIPLLGMVLGNTMTGISIGLANLSSTLKNEGASIQARLALGFTKWKACEGLIRQSLHMGMIGIVNNMSAAGLVFIPGMMTGQLMAGAEPIEAAKYQAMIMFLIAGSTAIGTTIAVFFAIWRLTDKRHRLRGERIGDK